MLFIRVMKNVLFLILTFVVAINANAKVLGNRVICPTLDKIHQAAPLMNHVECHEKSCGVMTDKPAFYENGLYWILAMGGIPISSENEMILKAQNIAKGVTVMFSDIGMGSLCIYFVSSSDQYDDEMIGMVAWGFDSKHQIPFTLSFEN